MVNSDNRLGALEDELKLLKGEVKRTLVDLRAFVMREDSPLSDRVVLMRDPSKAAEPVASDAAVTMAAPMEISRSEPDRRVEALEDQLRSLTRQSEERESSQPPPGVPNALPSNPGFNPAAVQPPNIPNWPGQMYPPGAVPPVVAQIDQSSVAPTIQPSVVVQTPMAPKDESSVEAEVENRSTDSQELVQGDKAENELTRGSKQRSDGPPRSVRRFDSRPSVDDWDPDNEKPAAKDRTSRRPNGQGRPSASDSRVPPRSDSGQISKGRDEQYEDDNEMIRKEEENGNGHKSGNGYHEEEVADMIGHQSARRRRGNWRDIEPRDMYLPEFSDDEEDDEWGYDYSDEEQQRSPAMATSSESLDVNMMSNLVRWVFQARRRVGQERLMDFLELYLHSCKFGNDLREMIVYVSTMVEEETSMVGDPAQESVDLIHQLHGILMGGVVVSQKPWFTNDGSRRENRGY